MKRTSLSRLLLLIGFVGCLLVIEQHVRSAGTPIQDPKPDETFGKVVQPFFVNNCFACHDEDLQTANLNLAQFKSTASLVKERATMKLILDKLKAGEMPPPQSPRPRPEELTAVIDWLSGQLGQSPKPTTTPTATEEPTHVTVRRLNRTEYDNTVRDLLGVDLHLSENFPQDDSGYGFDNNGDVLSLSPVLMEKYLAAAEKISRTAVFGVDTMKPTLIRLRTGERAQVPQFTPLTDYDLSGLSMPNAIHTTYRFPVNADYVIRATMGGVRPPGSGAFQLALWVDGVQTQTIQVDPASLASFALPSEPQELWSVKQEFKVKMTAGDHWIAVSIPHLYEGLPASYNGPNPSTRPVPPPRQFRPPPDLTPQQIEERRKEFEQKRAEKIPANGARVSSLELGGPYAQSKGAALESQKKIYACGHLNGHHTSSCARFNLERLAHRAYRRPVGPKDIAPLLLLFQEVQKETNSFDEATAVAVQAMLVSPQFLFRFERGRTATTPKLTQHELASRLSYFLWSSMPDDALLEAADKNKLNTPAQLTAQVKRMLLDPKADALIANFGGQWLQVRKLESVKPDSKRFPDFDEYLRLSMSRETEMFFANIMHEDRSILDFIDADYSFLNERLARFYNVPNVQGPDFRKVVFSQDAHRGGLLGQAGVLTISSYANRTSPVIRGRWVLENLVGSPPPPPPPDVPNLDEAKIGKTSSMREQLEQHRKNAVCASCHSRMDPLGFGLENFDAIGAWRVKDGDFVIDPSGTLPDGRSFSGPQGLKDVLKSAPNAFADTLTRKLMIYGLGRGLEPADDDAVKSIVKAVTADNYRFSSVILGIVNSEPFQKRRGASAK
jgi:hypothetical protein